MWLGAHDVVALHFGSLRLESGLGLAVGRTGREQGLIGSCIGDPRTGLLVKRGEVVVCECHGQDLALPGLQLI